MRNLGAPSRNHRIFGTDDMVGIHTKQDLKGVIHHNKKKGLHEVVVCRFIIPSRSAALPLTTVTDPSFAELQIPFVFHLYIRRSNVQPLVGTQSWLCQGA